MGIHIGLDIGIASVGWAVVNDEYDVLESGSNIFNSADANMNMERRDHRQLRRLHRRKKTRMEDFHKLWVASTKCLPSGKCNNQLQLRVKGLSEPLMEKELFFVLDNMLHHRGISYLEDALDEPTSAKSEYQKGLLINEKELRDKLPCEIQWNRLQHYGKYRGTIAVTESGENTFLSNVFTIDSYRRELEKLFDEQKKYHDFLTNNFIGQYLEIFNRKRKYYEGPGNELSRTDYGIYTTEIDSETGEFITEKNIFDKLIGKCSVFKDQERAAGASYTAQEFNALNDLNNLTINNRKLLEEEKREIIKAYKEESSINVKKIIRKIIGEDIESFSGARVDKNNKELFHTLEIYRKMRKEMEKCNLDIQNYDRDMLDRIGRILTLNSDKEGILLEIGEAKLELTEEEMDFFVLFRKKNGALFNKWQSFSLKVMNMLIPEMYATAKEQMTILSEWGMFKTKSKFFKDFQNIPASYVVKEIYNPVVRRSVRIAIQIINQLIKKYGNPKEIVIEMPRDKNGEEQKNRIKEFQRNQEKEISSILSKIEKEYGRKIKEEDYKRSQQLNLKLKLWNEQGGRCLYSGKTIEIAQLLDEPELFEIDHIIPRSISFDDSRTNKVLVYASENQAKGNETPYFYLNKVHREWKYKQYKAYVSQLSLSKKKVERLLYTEDITKIDVMKKFISRNLNDTRYASKIVLDVLQDYFVANQMETKIKVIRGSFTAQMRNNLRLTKHREENYAHHAVDAMLICYSQMGYNAYRSLQKDVINWETGEILNSDEFEHVFSDQFYEQQMYILKWWDLSQKIKVAEKNVKYWHKVDRKPNRTLCNQTIRGTRVINGATYKINKLDIRTKKGFQTFKSKIEKGKQNDFLMACIDPRSFDMLLRIMEDYSDAENPFLSYEQETGDIIRKYAKNGNGPRIGMLKYKDGEVGSCIDVSHKYGHERGSRKVILESLNPYRMDVYYSRDTKQYHLVGIKYSDCCYWNGNYIINEESYNAALCREHLISENESWRDLNRKGIEFQLTFYKNEIIQYEKNGEFYTERFSSRTMPKKKNYIETKPIEKNKFENKSQNLVGLSKTKYICKIRTDILGNSYTCEKEEFSFNIDRC